MRYIPYMLTGVFLVATLSRVHAQIVPVELDNSGFLVDAIWEAGGNYNSDLSNDASGSTSYVLVSQDEATASGLDPAGALPDDGTITTSSGVVFQLQPYGQDNVFFLGASSRELDLAPSAQSSYTELSFLVSRVPSRAAASVVSFTLNFADGVAPVTLTTADVVPLITDAPGSDAEAAATLTSYDFKGTPVSGGDPIYLDEYDFAVSAPPGAILQSITIDPGSDQLDVYAVSGVDPTPEPRVWLLLAAGLGLMGLVGRRTRPGFPAGGLA